MKPASYAGQKRLIQLSREQEERMAQQSVQKIQAFVGEANNVQARRCEVMVALLSAHTQHVGIQAVTTEDVATCKKAADLAVELDARQKFEELKRLFVELGIAGPQPHLEWAARQVGVTLFDEQPDEAPHVLPAVAQGAPGAVQ